MYVDNIKIPFTGLDIAEYFADHYSKLGYTIQWDKDKWKNTSTSF